MQIVGVDIDLNVKLAEFLKQRAPPFWMCIQVCVLCMWHASCSLHHPCNTHCGGRYRPRWCCDRSSKSLRPSVVYDHILVCNICIWCISYGLRGSILASVVLWPNFCILALLRSICVYTYLYYVSDVYHIYVFVWCIWCISCGLRDSILASVMLWPKFWIITPLRSICVNMNLLNLCDAYLMCNTDRRELIPDSVLLWLKFSISAAPPLPSSALSLLSSVCVAYQASSIMWEAKYVKWYAFRL